MENTRFEIVKNSKFDKLSNDELQTVKGGLCISCMKKSKKCPLNLSFKAKVDIPGSPTGK